VPFYWHAYRRIPGRLARVILPVHPHHVRHGAPSVRLHGGRGAGADGAGEGGKRNPRKEQHALASSALPAARAVGPAARLPLIRYDEEVLRGGYAACAAGRGRA
jgi:hypothetical protein